MHPFLGRLIVNFVLCLICFIAYSSQIFIIWPWYGRELSVELLYLLAPFNTLVGLLLWNYFLCVNTDPGRVPEGWKPECDEDGVELKKLTGKPRHCRMCENYKPPRAHHCRQCNRCILRMDHHCPWINNCVGHHNYAYFIRFLFYVDVACSYHLAMVTKKVIGLVQMQYWDDPSTLELVMIILNYVACIPVLLAVGGFSLYHFYCLIANMTTIEGWEKDKVALMVKRGKLQEIRFPYDLGARRNIESILGSNPLLWCWPRPPIGSGLKYELSKKDASAVHKLIGLFSTGEAWPPQDNSSSSSSPKSAEYYINASSPWTYQNEGLNPALRPSNATARQSSSRKRQGYDNPEGTDSYLVPPYHPDFREPDEGSDTSDDEENADYNRVRVRRGSEGYEVRPQNREDMLRKYLEDLGEKPGKYVRYIPEPDDSSEDEDENLPLALAQAGRTNNIRA